MNWATFFIGFFCGAFVSAYATVPKLRDRVNTAFKNFFLGAVKGSGKQSPKVVNGKARKGKQDRCLKCGEVDYTIDMQPALAENGKQMGWIHSSCARTLKERPSTTSYRDE